MVGGTKGTISLGFCTAKFRSKRTMARGVGTRINSKSKILWKTFRSNFSSSWLWYQRWHGIRYSILKGLWEDGGCPSETQKNLPSKKSKKFIQIPWPNNPFHTPPPWPPTAAHLQILAFLPWQHWASVSPPNADVKNLHLHPLLQRASGSSLPGSACSMPSETCSRSVGKGVRCASTHVFY